MAWKLPINHLFHLLDWTDVLYQDAIFLNCEPMTDSGAVKICFLP
jgi:hypothetical protein